jgi:hypothetical protein
LFVGGVFVVADERNILQRGAQTVDLAACKGCIWRGVDGRNRVLSRQARVLRAYFADIFDVLRSKIVVW